MQQTMLYVHIKKFKKPGIIMDIICVNDKLRYICVE